MLCTSHSHHQGVAAFTDPWSQWHLNFSRFMIMPGIISGDEKLSHTVVSILTSTSSSISFISNFLFHLFYYCFTCGVCWGGCGGMSHMLWWMDRGQMTALGSPFSSACLFMTSGDGTLLTRLAAAQPVPCLLVKLVLRQDRSELIWSPD